mgnify:CR=1 FL=1
MGTSPKVVFRYDETISPKWQFYGVDCSVYGGADELRIAVDEATTMLGEEPDCFIEWRSHFGGEEQFPEVFVRAHRTDDEKWIGRNDLAQEIRAMLAEDPGLVSTFGVDFLTGTGAIVAIAALAEDTVSDALSSYTVEETAHIAMRLPSEIAWATLIGPKASRAESVDSLKTAGINLDTTVGDLMNRTGNRQLQEAKKLVAV